MLVVADVATPKVMKTLTSTIGAEQVIVIVDFELEVFIANDREGEAIIVFFQYSCCMYSLLSPLCFVLPYFFSIFCFFPPFHLYLLNAIFIGIMVTL